MSQSTMNLARQDSGEVSNKAENVKRTKIQKRLKTGYPIFGLKVLLRMCKMYLGQGIHCLTKTLFLRVFTIQCPQMNTNVCNPSTQKLRYAFNCKFSNWCNSFYHLAPTIEERALCIYGFRVVLRFCRQLFSSVKYFCGFLQLFTSFQYFIFIVQISFTNENLYISAGTKEEIVRTKVENKLQ